MPDLGVVLDRSGRVALEEIRVEPPGPGEVLVRIEATGVCHSDAHVIAENGWHHAFPILLGHEGAGTVAAVGEGVSRARRRRPRRARLEDGMRRVRDVPARRAALLQAPARLLPGGSSAPTGPS